MTEKKQGLAGNESNMQYWSLLKRPPESALRKITGGRLKGKSDINPQWRYEEMTRVFGPIGIGWAFEIVDHWERETSGEIAVFVRVAVKYKHGDIWTEPIFGIGGSKVLEAEKAGPHVNDEAYKMALTDALSVALKMIGVAADIYAGLWDGSKYIERKAKSATQKTEVTVGDISYVAKQIKTLGIEEGKFLAYLELEKLDDMKPFHFEKAIKGLKMKTEAMKNENNPV